MNSFPTGPKEITWPWREAKVRHLMHHVLAAVASVLAAGGPLAGQFASFASGEALAAEIAPQLDRSASYRIPELAVHSRKSFTQRAQRQKRGRREHPIRSLRPLFLTLRPLRETAFLRLHENSSTGAPARPLWVPLDAVYTVLVIAFGWGIWLSAEGNRCLRLAGGLIIATGVIGLFWPPMHLRGARATLTDTLHIVFGIGWKSLAVLTITFAAAALGKRFQIYSVVTLGIFVVFGTLAGMDGARIAAKLPTPWAGVWERVLIGAFLLWIVVLAVALLRTSAARPGRASPGDRLPDEDSGGSG